jgi:GT2 family glycosyltransferase
MDERQASDAVLVSVILPVHNGAQYLKEALESVFRQAYRPLEIIVVDDGSTDETAAIAGGFGKAVRYFRQENAGPAAARNLGIRNALGSLIAFIDADDLWPEEKLTVQLRCFEFCPKLDIVQGLIRRLQLPDPAQPRAVHFDTDVTFIHTNLGSMLMRRSVFDVIGWFDERLRFHEDTDFWLRAMERNLHVVVQRRLGLIYRIHGRSTTSGKNAQTMGLANVVRRSMLRRRTPSGDVPPLPPLTFLQDVNVQNREVPATRKQALQAWPLISIIAYGEAASRPGRAMLSIVAQDYRPVELLVLGREPSLHMARAADQFVRLVEVEARAELAAGLNAAVDKAQGELVAFLDLAGEWTLGKLKAQAARLLASPGAAYVAGRTRRVIDPLVTYPASEVDAASVKARPGELLPTLMVRRRAFSEVGEFAGGLSGVEDTDWILRAHDRGFPKNILPQAVFLRYVGRSSDSPPSQQTTAALLESVRAAVRRKRDPGVPVSRVDSE